MQSAKIETIHKLNLSNCPKLLLSAWHNVPIKSMQLWGGAIDEFTDSIQMSEMRNLTFYGCRQTHEVQWEQ